MIGVTVQIAADDSGGSSQNAGVGFAVPSNTVKRVVEDLVAGRTVQHAYLGVSLGTNMNGTGAVIGTVRTGGPAAAAASSPETSSSPSTVTRLLPRTS